eukprot:1907927-Prymnesium_polylepis.1
MPAIVDDLLGRSGADLTRVVTYPVPHNSAVQVPRRTTAHHRTNRTQRTHAHTHTRTQPLLLLPTHACLPRPPRARRSDLRLQ